VPFFRALAAPACEAAALQRRKNNKKIYDYIIILNNVQKGCKHWLKFKTGFSFQKSEKAFEF
jgi:hypothetical protein